MKFRSALEDFVDTSFAALDNVLAKLEYASSLRDENGKYSHWGLAKKHGSAQAEQAVAEAHAQVFLEFLRTPIRELASLVTSGNDANRELLERLLPRGADRIIPSDCKGGCAKHFKSTLRALAALQGGQKRRPAA